MLSRDELAAWLRLATNVGIGRAVARRLLAAFGSPEHVLVADDDTLRALVGPGVTRTLKRRDAQDEARLVATLRWLDASTPAVPHDIVTLDDPRYPALLLETADPPLLLFTRGRAELLSAPGIAIVGSRKATPHGLENAHEFARFLSTQSLTVVSGLALGIDGAAHRGALAGAGSTIAFVGTGLDRIYPPKHAELTRLVAEQGLVASEYALGAEALPINFPRRNRLIAGISLGTLVVEAAIESGSLITARLALEEGRDVFAIPGSIHSEQSRGCHRLIQEGATLVECGEDVLRGLRLEARAAAPRATLSRPQPSLFERRANEPADDGDAQDPLREALGHDPVTFDALAARTGMPSDQLAARLLDLELAGVVQRLPGGLLQRCARA